MSDPALVRTTLTGTMATKSLIDSIYRAARSPPATVEESRNLYRAALHLASRVETPFETLNRLTFSVSKPN